MQEQLGHAIDLILDGGSTLNEPSTVLDLCGPVPIVLRQGKSGRLVRIKVYSELKTLLDATKREAVTILTNTRGRPWTGDGFRASWGTACDNAGVEGVTFHDLRGTFVTSAYRAHGASIREIAEVTGHSERDAEAIIRKHYLAGDSAIDRMEEKGKHGATDKA